MKKNNVEIMNTAVEAAMEFKGSRVKKVCWQLFYDREGAFKQLKIFDHFDDENLSAEVLAKEILEGYRQDVCGTKIPLNFGSAEPLLTDMGVELGIKSPIVRDVLLDRCHEIIYGQRPLNDGLITKVIKLFKTPEDADNHESRVVGGLKQIRFTNSEANWLYKTTNLYPFGILLERLLMERTKIDELEQQHEAEQKVEETDKVEQHHEAEQKAEETARVEPKQKPKQVSSFVSGVNEYKEQIKQLYELMGEEDTLGSITEKLEKYKKELQRIEEILSIVELFRSVGLNPEELIERKEAVVNLFAALDQFAA